MRKEINILMIDSSEEDFIIIRGILIARDSEKYTVERASTYAEGLAAIARKKHDAYLVDHQTGGARLVKEAIAAGCEAPLIILAKQNTVEIDKEAIEAGAADFILKGAVSPQVLDSSIRYAIAQATHMKHIRQINAGLEKRVKDRTMILEEALRELEHSREELSLALEREKELNELKSRFVSMASHEFRTPLATILSSVTLVEKYSAQGEQERQSRHVNRIKEAIGHLTELLNDVLSLSKLEEGKVPLSPEEFDLSQFTEQTIGEMRQLATGEQQIHYSHGGRCQVKMDKKILRNILFNLVSNALKFSSKPVDVRSEVNNSHITLSVSDRGIGISEEDQKHLFERFFRGQNATNVQGTGLGLNIVGKYVEMLGGSIGFKSKLEEGTTFIVELPNHLHHE